MPCKKTFDLIHVGVFVITVLSSVEITGLWTWSLPLQHLFIHSQFEQNNWFQQVKPAVWTYSVCTRSELSLSLETHFCPINKTNTFLRTLSIPFSSFSLSLTMTWNPEMLLQTLNRYQTSSWKTNKRRPRSPFLFLPLPLSHKHNTVLSYPALAWEICQKNDKSPWKEREKWCESESGARVMKGESRQEGRRVRAIEQEYEETKGGSRCRINKLWSESGVSLREEEGKEIELETDGCWGQI